MTQTQDPLLGNQIARCRLEALVAQGGMGSVYRASSPKHHGEVAVKILAPALSLDKEYVERFFREADAACRIDHPNVVKVLDFGKELERYYIVMEFVRGAHLGELLFQKRRLSLEVATRIVRDVARGLEAAGALGIIHRDIKPQNILMARGNVPKITDFGLVRDGTKASALTLEGVFMGTPEYVSPEQADGRTVSHRSDLYSLGVTYYQLLSGRLPFQGKTAMEMAMARLRHEPRPIEHALPDVDPRAAAVIHKLLRRDPAHRYASASDLIRDLDAILSGGQPTATKRVKLSGGRIPWIKVPARRALAAILFSLCYGAAALAALGLGALVSAEARRSAFPAVLWEGLRFDLSRPALGEILAAAGALFALAAFVTIRGAIGRAGRPSGVVVCLVAAMACAYAGALGLDHAAYMGDLRPWGEEVLRRVGAALLRPANVILLAAGFLLYPVAAAWRRDAGTARYALWRLMPAASLFLVYAVAVGGALRAPLEHFRASIGTLLPIATCALLCAGFGAELAIGYRWGNAARVLGVLLLLLASAGVVLFAVGGIHPGMGWVEWSRLAGERFAGAARDGFGQGAGLGIAVVALLAAVLFLHASPRVNTTRRRSGG